MAIFPVRRLGSAGITPDIAPEDLESVSSFSSGVNVRFKGGRASRAPVFRTVGVLEHEPGHLLSIPPVTAAYDEIISVAADFGSVVRLNGSAIEDLSPVDLAPVEGDQVITSGFIGGIVYLNRETHAPLVKRPTDDTFVELPNWPETDRARVLRHYRDQMIALGVTKAGAYLPTLVRWSDFVYFGEAPGSWDPADPTKSAGENIINGLDHAIVDGAPLRDSFIIYGIASVWQMDFVGGNDIYQFRRIFKDRGLINPNCVVEVDSLHYAFDREDIYVHDGVSPRSICDDRARRFIFDALDYSKTNLCFVQHDPKLSEVRFSYPSSDALVAFGTSATGCNRQAVFNYSNDTWTFYDVPNIVASTKAAIYAGDNWSDMDRPWDGAAGMWSSNDNDAARHVLVAGRTDLGSGLTAPRIYGQDLIAGGRLSLPIEPETLRPAFLERIGIDLDAYGKHLTQHVNLQAVWPQVRMDEPAECTWQFGGNNLPGQLPQWSDPQSFDPATESKIDINESGKYLAWRFKCAGVGDFDLSALDVQIMIRGRR